MTEANPLNHHINIVAMKNNLVTLLAGLACMSLIGITGCTGKKEAPLTDNPFVEESTLPFHAPDFANISDDDFMPAFEEGIRLQREEIRQITDNKEAPTFDNTIIAFEQSGSMLRRVSSVFFKLVEADGTEARREIQEKAVKLLTDWENELNLNRVLFDRIKTVYDNERESLTGEDRVLLDYTYHGFEQNGAALPEESRDEFKQLNSRLSELTTLFDRTIVEALAAQTVWTDDVTELDGLTEAQLAQCRTDAQARGGQAEYALVLTNTTQQPIMASLNNRAMRERVFNASIHRADGQGVSGANTWSLISEIAQLRARKAQLLGFPDYASYSLHYQMAGTSQAVDDFLLQLKESFVPKAEKEMQSIRDFARKTEGSTFELQPWDVSYYSAKMKEEKYHFSEAEVQPYFDADSVLINGVFYAANRVYGLSFEERFDLPVYAEDVRVFTIKDSDGSDLGLFYIDLFHRDTKGPGAWMDEFITQSSFDGTLPVIYNCCNFTKAGEGQPNLISWDNVTTMFHEFGHALHGFLSDNKYRSISGTNTPRDFVELPSQFNEYFATVPEIFDNYARHHETGEPMPKELKEKMLSSMKYLAAYALGENLVASTMDIEWHKLTPDRVPSAEEAADWDLTHCKEMGLYWPAMPPRYYQTYFSHVWGGGYAAGYYSYLWTEVLAVNCRQRFERDGWLNPEVAADFRTKILSKGRTVDLNQAFSDFTGLEHSDASALLPARGIK